MRFQSLLSLALLPHTTAAFRASPRALPTAAATRTVLRTSLARSGDDEANADKLVSQLPVPKKRGRRLSRLTTFTLSALTELKKDEMRGGKVNMKRRPLKKTGIATTGALLVTFARSTVARAATPLVVMGGAITPLISSPPGVSVVGMPRPLYDVGRTTSRGAWLFALALFVTAALLRNAGEGYTKLTHLVAKHLGRIMVGGDEEGEIELGLPEETDWGTYSRSALGFTQEKKKVERRSNHELDKRTMLFERTKTDLEFNNDAEDAKLQEATRFFLEQKYRQHHHPVHVARSRFENASYLDTLAVNREEMRHDTPRGYLDTLSDARRSTWDTYKLRLDEAKPAGEVEELKQEVLDLRGMMITEQSMYRTSNQALKLAVEAQNEEMQHSSAQEELKEFDRKLSMGEELKAFDKKAQEYEATVVKDAAKMTKNDSKETRLSG